jgi:hypothetical protein
MVCRAVPWCACVLCVRACVCTCVCARCVYVCESDCVRVCVCIPPTHTHTPPTPLRPGRTGRAGETGTAYTFFGSENAKCAYELVQVLKSADQVPRYGMHVRVRAFLLLLVRVCTLIGIHACCPGHGVPGWPLRLVVWTALYKIAILHSIGGWYG